jgi:hypothetical protein
VFHLFLLGSQRLILQVQEQLVHQFFLLLRQRRLVDNTLLRLFGFFQREQMLFQNQKWLYYVNFNGFFSAIIEKLCVQLNLQ